MKFTSLQDAYKNYIQSFPEFTHLDLTANEIKLIELILSYTRRDLNFYMNYSDIADYLVVSKGKNKAKVIEKIVRSLTTKGYIIKDTKHNYNGKQGGSSTTMQIDESFLEEQLHRAFNPERFMSSENEEDNIEQTTAITHVEEAVTIEKRISAEPFKNPVSNLWDFDEDEDEPKYIDADIAHIIAHDGISVKLKEEPKLIAATVKIAAESVTKPQLSKEQIKNHLRSLLTKEEHSGQHGTINIMLNDFATTKTDEQYNEYYYYILESLGLK